MDLSPSPAKGTVARERLRRGIPGPKGLKAMSDIKGDKLYVELGASEVRRRLKGHGFGVRKVYSDGKNRAVVIHTATGDHLRDLEALFPGAIRSPSPPG